MKDGSNGMNVFIQRSVPSILPPTKSSVMLRVYASAIVLLTLMPLHVNAISVFAESFAAPSSNTWSFGSGVPINTSIWSTYTNGNHGARITNGRLEVTSRRSSSAHGQGFAYVPCGGTGSQFDNGIYNPVLAQNGALVTWTFNMRKAPSNATTNGGFSCTSSSNQNGVTIGLGFILATNSAAGILSATNNCNPNGTSVGYAVLHGGNNRIRLVRFTNSIHNGAISNIAESQNVSYSNYHSVRVTYDPATNGWTLQVRSDGSSSFSNPAQGTYPSTANGTDGTHVNTSLDFMGGYFQAGCIGVCDDASSGYIALFDNINVDVACVPPPSPGPISGPSEVCQSVDGTYSIDDVPGAVSYTWTYTGTGVTLAPSGTSVVLSFDASATSGNLNVISVGDCSSAPQSFPITVQPLPVTPVVSGLAQVCEGSVQTYSVVEVPGEEYEWTWPAGWEGATTGASIAATTGTDGGTLTVTATNACGAGPVATLDVVVDPAPEVGLEAFPLICISTPEFPFTGGSPAGGVYTFNGVPATSFNPIVGIGSYTIVYTFTDTTGCVASAEQVLEVDACAGIVELEAGLVRAYPNPVNGGNLYVEAPEEGDLFLHDATGRVVAKAWYASVGGRHTMYVGNLKPGTYVISFLTRNGTGSRIPVVLW